MLVVVVVGVAGDVVAPVDHEHALPALRGQLLGHDRAGVAGADDEGVVPFRSTGPGLYAGTKVRALLSNILPLMDGVGHARPAERIVDATPRRG